MKPVVTVLAEMPASELVILPGGRLIPKGTDLLSSFGPDIEPVRIAEAQPPKNGRPTILRHMQPSMRIWRRAVAIKNDNDILLFIKKWGLIHPWRNWGSYKYIQDISRIYALLDRLRLLGRLAESGDRDALAHELSGNTNMVARNVELEFSTMDNGTSEMMLRANSLLQFMILEIWSDATLGSPTIHTVKTCARCGGPFRVGGPRSSSMRRDAIYCGRSCVELASRERRRNAAVQKG